MGSCNLRWPYPWLRIGWCFEDIQSGCAKGKWQALTYSAGPIFVWSDARLPYFLSIRHYAAVKSKMA